MPPVTITQRNFLEDPLGKSYRDVARYPGRPFDAVFDLFNKGDRQLQMEQAERDGKPALAGVVKELESDQTIAKILNPTTSPNRSRRLRQAIGMVTRMFMEARGWKKKVDKYGRDVKGPLESARWFGSAQRYVKIICIQKK